MFECGACPEVSGEVCASFVEIGELTEVEAEVEVGAEFLSDTGVEIWVAAGVEAP